MPQIDPKYVFWLSVAIAVCGVGSNTAIWAGALPADVIPMIAQWNRIFSSVGQVVLPLLLGQGMTVAGRVSAAAAVDGLKGLEVDPKIAQTVSDAVGTSARVITTKP